MWNTQNETDRIMIVESGTTSKRSYNIKLSPMSQWQWLESNVMFSTYFHNYAIKFTFYTDDRTGPSLTHSFTQRFNFNDSFCFFFSLYSISLFYFWSLIRPIMNDKTICQTNEVKLLTTCTEYAVRWNTQFSFSKTSFYWSFCLIPCR